ncbi:hypothetical protein GCM10010399_63590 [Dactylosporangium fulvum]|uniref:GIY-YIG domain-containing protein n=1 Tax=Dactylosporangium fulvum TaxID=53359 RepID=A0ABY5W728_9ACTN|nr:hypothetical protein [Dactylosporangium fulvum]UWP85818.1 hypothetical protein Dfulv_16860 [Dactylosporangium fulvum]
MTENDERMAPTTNIATLDSDVTMSTMRIRWDALLTLVNSRSKKAMCVLREAAVRSVRERTLTLAFRHPSHANMLTASPGVALWALGEMYGGEWRIICEVAAAGRPPAASADGVRRPLCERFGGKGAVLGNQLGRYLDVGLVSQLPSPAHREDLVIERGYAVGFGGWFFFADLPPALAFGRAARTSSDCNSYGVYAAAMETRHCPQHGDERVLYAMTGGLSLDRNGDELAGLERWLQGVRANPRSAHWRAPTVAPAPILIAPEAPAVAPPSAGARCAVYLHYDADDMLLYVGMTDVLEVRGRQHGRKSSWAQFAVRGEHVWCDDRRAAERKEVELIRTLRPLFNDKHAAPDRDERLVAYLVGKGRYDLLTPAISRG